MVGYMYNSGQVACSVHATPMRCLQFVIVESFMMIQLYYGAQFVSKFVMFFCRPAIILSSNAKKCSRDDNFIER